MFQARPRSWVTTSDAQPELLAQPEQQRQDLAADRGVERRDRLVGDQQLRAAARAPRRSARAAAGRRRARAGSAGTTAPAGAARPRTAPRRPARPRSSRLVGDQPVEPEALGHRLVDGLPRVERARRRPGAPAAPGAGALAGRGAEWSSGWPSNRTSPAVGRCSPTSVRASVVLPEPDSPTSATTSPARTARSTPSRARATRPLRVDELDPDARAPRGARRRAVVAGHRRVRLADPDAGRRAGPPRRRRSARLGRQAAPSTARGQRGCERAAARAGRAGPAGRRAARPGANRAAGSPIRGNAAGQRAGVGVQRVGEDLLGRCPSSTTRPAYITATRSQTSASTDRSWLIIISPTPRSRTRSESRSSTCACTITSSAVVGSSATISCGSAGQRHRDHHPLLLAAGELVRVGAARAPGRARPARAARRPAPSTRAAGSLGSCSRIGSAICAPTRCTGLSECSAPWKTIEAPGPAHARAARPSCIVSTSSPVDAAPRRSTVAFVRLQPQDGAGQRRLAAAGLARPRPTISPRSTVEVDAAHRGQRPLARSGR